MGPGRRMKKQGPPASLEELGIVQKRKAGENDTETSRAKKRRKSEEANSPKKLVKLDRALRQERDAVVTEKVKTKRSKVVNQDAQVIPPRPTAVLVSSEEDEEQLEQSLLQDAELEDESEAEEEIDDVVVGKLDDISAGDSDSNSVFDSDEENRPRAIFSEDEDESDAEEKLTAANIEGLSRKLDKEQADADAEAQQELEDDALQTNIAGDEGLLEGEDPAAPGLAPDLQLLRSRITETIRILNDFSKLAAEGKSRTDYTTLLLSDICTYYGYTPYLAEKLFNLFPPMEAFAFFEANETPRPVVLRTNTLRTNRRTLAQALINRGVVLEPVGKWSKVGLQVFESAVPLGATPEYLAGHYILQAASSFLPVMALAPQPNERVLDMAAAPGGKTTYISALMRNTGTVFANDANRQRAKGLIGNVHRLGCKNVIVSNLDAKSFPKAVGGFDRVLLDAPCSGTGVIGKDPSVKTSKTEKDFMMLPHLQKQLLLAAIDSVDHASKTGGYIVYSTCSVTVEENEGVVQYVLRKRPNVRIEETGLGSFGSEGFKSYMGKKFDAKMNLTRRYFPHRENVDGFFVCKLKKFGPTPKAVAAALNGDVEAVTKSKGETVPVPTKKSKTNGVQAEVVGEVAFGGFDEEEDRKYMEKAEKKRLRRKGLDPRTASVSEKVKGQKEQKEQKGRSESEQAIDKKKIKDEKVDSREGKHGKKSSKGKSKS